VLADAVALTGIDEAVEAMRTLKIADAGRAALVVAARPRPACRAR
jgi:chromosome segregation protein